MNDDNLSWRSRTPQQNASDIEGEYSRWNEREEKERV